MCTTCGCNHTDQITIAKPGKINPQDLSFHPEHENHHHHQEKTVVDIELDILSKNNQLAERNRGFLEAKEIFAINLVSAPGSGKTTLLERTIRDLKNELDISVIEGDQQTFNDARRIEAQKVPVVQVNTGSGCHLDSDMIHRAIKTLQPKDKSLMIIENVGNLVCPALFDLGENKRVVIISVTEGDDKPAKYPDMFLSSDLCLINKLDLLPYVQFDVENAKKLARQVNRNLEFIEVSATTGEGMDAWYSWLKTQMNVK
ncbi:MAG: hydrogenase nickel incorporation protein HypB [Bacteroidales bacterium]|nr:hydrogenase nickel incorporation protein HypB [Bacteroidales bacterium]